MKSDNQKASRILYSRGGNMAPRNNQRCDDSRYPPSSTRSYGFVADTRSDDAYSARDYAEKDYSPNWPLRYYSPRDYPKDDRDYLTAGSFNYPSNIHSPYHVSSEQLAAPSSRYNWDRYYDSCHPPASPYEKPYPINRVDEYYDGYCEGYFTPLSPPLSRSSSYSASTRSYRRDVDNNAPLSLGKPHPFSKVITSAAK
jgi:hypothetical protein